MAIPDLSKLTLDELIEMGDDAVHNARVTKKNLAGFPIAKAKADDALAEFPKTALAIDLIEDTIDGEYVVVNVGVNGALRKVLVDDGGILTNEGHVRGNANRAIKTGGHFEQMEALL